MPIRRVKYGDRHPHVVVLEGDNENISVGLTTSNKRGDLTPVRYSNGKKGYKKRNADRKDKYFYDRLEKYHLDVESENKAYKIAINKLLKDLENRHK